MTPPQSKSRWNADLFVDATAGILYLDFHPGKKVAMALSIKTEEAERLERLRGEQEAQGDDVSRMTAFVRERANRYDRRPVTRREWDEAVGDTSEDPGVSR